MGKRKQHVTVAEAREGQHLETRWRCSEERPRCLEERVSPQVQSQVKCAIRETLDGHSGNLSTPMPSPLGTKDNNCAYTAPQHSAEVEQFYKQMALLERSSLTLQLIPPPSMPCIDAWTCMESRGNHSSGAAKTIGPGFGGGNAKASTRHRVAEGDGGPHDRVRKPSTLFVLSWGS